MVTLHGLWNNAIRLSLCLDARWTLYVVKTQLKVTCFKRKFPTLAPGWGWCVVLCGVRRVMLMALLIPTLTVVSGGSGKSNQIRMKETIQITQTGPERRRCADVRQHPRQKCNLLVFWR